MARPPRPSASLQLFLNVAVALIGGVLAAGLAAVWDDASTFDVTSVLTKAFVILVALDLVLAFRMRSRERSDHEV